MDERLTALLGDVARADELAGADRARAGRRTAWLADATSGQLAEFLQSTAELDAPLSAAGDELLAAALASVNRQRREATAWTVDEKLIGPVVSLYQQLGDSSPSRAQLLALLASSAEPKVLRALVELLIAVPPIDDAQVVQALAPLFRRGTSPRALPTAALFPRFLDALAHPQLAAPVLDLANFLTREHIEPVHPASSRRRQLTALLGEIVQSLAKLEESPHDDGASPVELSKRVASQVALAVSLCDALALIGERDAIGKLNQALQLRHRRLRTEAAAALARLGDDDGVAELVKLAEEPVARLRVLAYADELGLTNRIEPTWQTPLARAEAQLALWLAEPTQFGIPPQKLELFDQRRQFWPGFAGEVDCFLFRFTYTVTVEGAGVRTLSNIGIAGPLAHAFLADLADLPPDDIYAAFAGWQAEHEEIREFDVARLSQSEKLEVERLTRRLHDAGYEAIEQQFMGYFFGEKALVARATHEWLPGVAVADFRETAFFPERHSRRPLGPREAYSIYKGRKLLRSFNRSGGQPAA
jgi:HEAT repeat protein